MANVVALDVAECEDIGAFLESLNADQWDAPSLCAGWRVRDVVGHLVTAYERGPVRLVGEIVECRLSIDRALARIAIRRASTTTPDDLIAAWRARRRGRGIAKLVPRGGLFYDHFVHHQDIRRPLGAPRDIPSERALALLDYALHVGGGGTRSKQRARGLRLVACDLGWSHGDGPEIRGASEAILIALAGREVALAELEGDGVAILAPRVALAARDD